MNHHIVLPAMSCLGLNTFFLTKIASVTYTILMQFVCVCCIHKVGVLEQGKNLYYTCRQTYQKSIHVLPYVTYLI